MPDTSTDPRPLILTLRLDEDSFTRFDGERRRYFPTHRNFVPAHLTLFHHLPGERLAGIACTLVEISAGQKPFVMFASSLRFLGRGLAYQLQSPELDLLRARLAIIWSSDLTRQDSQMFRPHITIQNKADPPIAEALFEERSASFRPFQVIATSPFALAR